MSTHGSIMECQKGKKCQNAKLYYQEICYAISITYYVVRAHNYSISTNISRSARRFYHQNNHVTIRTTECGQRPIRTREWYLSEKRDQHILMTSWCSTFLTLRCTKFYEQMNHCENNESRVVRDVSDVAVRRSPPGFAS